GIAFSPDGDLLAAGGPDGSLRLWDVPARRLAGSLRGHQFGVSHVGFAAGGVLVSANGGAAGGVPAATRLWDIPSHRLLATLPGDPRVPIAPFAVSPDGRTLAAGSPEHRVVVWDIASRQQLESMEGESG